MSRSVTRSGRGRRAFGCVSRETSFNEGTTLKSDRAVESDHRSRAAGRPGLVACDASGPASTQPLLLRRRGYDIAAHWPDGRRTASAPSGADHLLAHQLAIRGFPVPSLGMTGPPPTGSRVHTRAQSGHDRQLVSRPRLPLPASSPGMQVRPDTTVSWFEAAERHRPARLACRSARTPPSAGPKPRQRYRPARLALQVRPDTTSQPIPWPRRNTTEPRVQHSSPARTSSSLRFWASGSATSQLAPRPRCSTRQTSSFRASASPPNREPALRAPRQRHQPAHTEEPPQHPADRGPSTEGTQAPPAACPAARPDRTPASVWFRARGSTPSRPSLCPAEGPPGARRSNPADPEHIAPPAELHVTVEQEFGPMVNGGSGRRRTPGPFGSSAPAGPGLAGVAPSSPPGPAHGRSLRRRCFT